MSYDRLLERVQLFYKLAVYGNRDKFLQAMGQQVSTTNIPFPGGGGAGYPHHDRVEDVPPPSPPMINATPVEITGTPPKAQLPAIPLATQTQLSDLLVPQGLIPIKLKEDGIVGDKTRQALTAFQTKYKMPATPANIKTVHDTLEQADQARSGDLYGQPVALEKAPGLDRKNPF